MTAVRGGVPLPQDEPTSSLPLCNWKYYTTTRIKQPKPVKARGLRYEVERWEKELEADSHDDAQGEESSAVTHSSSTAPSPTSSTSSLDWEPITPPSHHASHTMNQYTVDYWAKRYGPAWMTAYRIKAHGEMLAEARERTDPAHRQRLLALLNGGTQRRSHDHGLPSPLCSLWELETPPSSEMASVGPVVF